MKTEGKQIWQMAAGDTDRNFVNLCLNQGIIVLGPGSRGSMKTPHIEDMLRSDGISSRMITMLNKFANQIKIGDVVVLRLGKSEVHGVGIIRGEYSWSEALSDIDGWDLCHFYHVEWVWAKPESKPEIFKDALKFGDSLQFVNKSEKTGDLLAWIASLPEPKDTFTPIPLPECGKKLTIDELCQPLYDYGIGLNNLSDLKDCISELQALAHWYRTYSNNPSEHETVTHLVVPLLKALGWTPQRIELEYSQSGIGRADIALYSYGNREPQYLTAIVEAKKFQRSCLKAETQVKNYATLDANRLIVTDGIRYGVFVKNNSGEFPSFPSAYMNLAHLLDSYPIYGKDCKGADEALWLMNADWRPEFSKLKILNKKEVIES